MAGDHGGDPLAATLKVSKPPQFYLNLGKRWLPSMVRYGGFAGIMFLYFTDWKVFMDKVPFYNAKFEEKEPLVKF